MNRTAMVGCAAGIAAVLVAGATLATPHGRNLAWAALTRLRGRETVESRLASIGPACRDELRSWSAAAGLTYPPREVALVVLKDRRVIEVYGRSDTAWARMAVLPITGASGGPGPKLREGDGQVPEGIYAVESLNPNSRFHLALRVGYPNEADRGRATQDGRHELGGDIMIHGGSASIGCVAVGDEAIERLFVLVADTGLAATHLILAPTDLRRAGAPAQVAQDSPPWLGELHEEIRAALAAFPPSDETLPTAPAPQS